MLTPAQNVSCERATSRYSSKELCAGHPILGKDGKVGWPSVVAALWQRCDIACAPYTMPREDLPRGQTFACEDHSSRSDPRELERRRSRKAGRMRIKRTLWICVDSNAMAMRAVETTAVCLFQSAYALLPNVAVLRGIVPHVHAGERKGKPSLPSSGRHGSRTALAFKQEHMRPDWSFGCRTETG